MTELLSGIWSNSDAGNLSVSVLISSDLDSEIIVRFPSARPERRIGAALPCHDDPRVIDVSLKPVVRGEACRSSP